MLFGIDPIAEDVFGYPPAMSVCEGRQFISRAPYKIEFPAVWANIWLGRGREITIATTDLTSWALCLGLRAFEA